MKKFVTLLVVSLVTLTAMAQEKVEKRIELKNGTILTGFVQEQQDGSYRVETESGDVLVFSSSEVERIVEGNLMTSNPQTNKYYEGMTLYKKGGNLHFYSSGQKLEQKDFTTYPGWEKYQKAQKKWRTGNTITITSAVSLAAGVGLLTPYLLANYTNAIEYTDSMELFLHIGGALSTVSVAMLVTGLIIKGNGNKQLTVIRDSYNQNPGYALNFGAQQHGLGLALVF